MISANALFRTRFDVRSFGEGGYANQPNGTIYPGRWKGMKAAVADLDKGVLQLNEYPPLPSPPFHSAYTRLLKTECGGLP